MSERGGGGGGASRIGGRQGDPALTPEAVKVILGPDGAWIATIREASTSAAWSTYLFGAQAAAVYGNRRVTVDIDITVDLGTLSIRALIDAMVSAGFAPRVSDALQLAQRARVLPVTHGASAMPLDVVLAGSGLEAEFLDRARELAIGALIVPVIAPEDLVIAKVLAGRPNDLADVEGVVAAQLPDLDLARVREVLGLLEAALDRSDSARPVRDAAGARSAVRTGRRTSR
jgi:hypothetical protein